MIYALIIGYAACWALSYGLFFAYFQGLEGGYTAAKDYRFDMGTAMGISVGGPISLFFAVFMTGLCEYGIKFR